MARWLRHLSCECEGLSLHSRNLSKGRRGSACQQGQHISGRWKTGWQNCCKFMGQQVQYRQKETDTKPDSNKVEVEDRYLRLSSDHIPRRYMHECTHTHTQTRTHTPRFLTFIYFYFMCTILCFVCIYVCVSHVYPVPRDIRAPEAEVTGSCAPPCGCWELNSLQEQPVLS